MRTRFLPILLVALLAASACDDMSEPTAPSATDDVLSQRGNDIVGVIVVLDDRPARGNRAANRERASEFARGVGLTATHTYGAALLGFAASVPKDRVGELRRNPNVRSVELDAPVSLPRPVVDARSSSAASEVQISSGTQVMPWGIDRTGAREGQGTGAGIHVYVLDTGIDPQHPDLQANVGDGYTVFECKGNPHKCPGWVDDNGHGTHVSGTIGALDDGSGVVGVAPEVTLHAVKVLGSGGSGSRSGVIAGIDWMVDHNSDRPRVANMSIGGAGEKPGTCTEGGIVGDYDAYHAAVCNATNAGVVVVTSAGNAGADASFQAPASYFDAAMAVSATSCGFIEGSLLETCETGSEAFTTWSNWGQGSDAGWPSGGSLPVAIAAPGYRVLSTLMGGGHGYKSGTSMASPHVAGGAALVLQALGGSQSPDGSALRTVRAALLGASECTETWHNVSGNPHAERFLNLRSSAPIDVCVEPGDPPPTTPTNMRATGATSSSIDLAWDHESPADAMFEIWEETDQWSHLAFVEGASSFTATGLSANTLYRYRVRTVTESQVSLFSNVVDATTLPDEDGDPPVAAFSYDCGNSDTCSFTNQSSGPIESWSWDLGNGQTSTSPNPPSATYAAAGTYTVTLTVEDALARADAAQAQISCSVKGKWLRCN